MILHQLQKTAPEAEFVGLLPPFFVATTYKIPTATSDFYTYPATAKEKRVAMKNTAPRTQCTHNVPHMGLIQANGQQDLLQLRQRERETQA